MTIKVNIEISEEVFEDVIVTALEGGSNYWYYLCQKAVDSAREACFKANINTMGCSLSETIAKSVLLAGATIPIRDAENEDEVLGHLCLTNIQNNIQKMVNEVGIEDISSHMHGSGDADSADTIFQYMVLGSQVFC